MAFAGDRAAEELTALLQRMEVPCAVVETASEGKHVKALKALAKGTVLFEERPIVAWPIHGNDGLVKPRSFCDACFAALPTAGEAAAAVEKCTGCDDAFYCSAQCRDRAAPQHGIVCGHLRRFREFHTSLAAQAEDLPPISVESMARCVAVMAAKFSSLKRQHPEGSDAELFEYAAHSFNRLLEPPLSAEFDDADPAAWSGVVRTALRAKLLAEVGAQVTEGVLSDETLRTLLGELSINAQGLFIKPRPELADAATNVEAAALFTLQSCFNHSCVPNARVTYGHDFDIAVEVTQDLAEGQQIFISYLPALVVELESVAKRRERLRPYFFVCGCPRCDAEEKAEKAAVSTAAPTEAAPSVATSAVETQHDNNNIPRNEKQPG
jgi:hypothetical protein